MEYHNPIHAIPKELLVGEQLELRDLRKIKKRLLTEFQLSDSITIELNGQEWDRNNVIRVFEQLEQDGMLNYHSIIYNDPELFAFLEKGDPAIFKEVERLERLFSDAGFLKFVEPFFVDKMNLALLQALKKGDFELIEWISETPCIPSFEYEAGAYQKAYRFCLNLLRELEKVAERSKRKTIKNSDLDNLCGENRINLLNALPDYFNEIRNQYASLLHDIALNLCNEHRKVETAKYVLSKGLELYLDDETIYCLEFLYKEIDDISRGARQSQRESSFWGEFPVWRVLWIIFILFTYFGQCSTL